MTTRRTVLAGLAASLTLPAQSWAAVGSPVVVSAAWLLDETYALVGLNRGGEAVFKLALPARGHAAAAHPTMAEVVAIARRPGTFAKVIDCATASVRQTLAAPDGRHFYGHAAFSADGTVLFTTENAYATGEGRIGVWDRTAGFVRVAEFSSGGIGPHEIIRLPNGHFAVANGGIRTHPATGREKLNLDTMRSNLTILSATGEILDQATLPSDHRFSSLRHIAVLADGTIGCGLQWQGDPFAAPSLLATFTATDGLTFARMSDALSWSLDGYIGSVGCLGTACFAASSPRGGQVLLFDAHGTVQQGLTSEDVCGVASTQSDETLVTDGFGRVFALSETRARLLGSHDLAFDNHLVSVMA